MGQGPRIEGIRLGQLPGRFGKVARLAGINHRHRETGRRQRRHHGPLIATRGFEHNQGGLYSLEPRHQGGNSGVIVGHGPTFSGGPHGNIELGFRHINTNKKRWSRHQHS
jgi:hypothetical protein